ncbi:MAG: DinB family protein [Pseudonocardia sp.]|nr:DinB family protein [Pseudonocardia sp.]
MTTPAELLADAFGRIRDDVAHAIDGLDADTLARRPDGADGPGNSIAWLVWHLTRVQDDHVAEAFGTEQVWPKGWSARFGLPFDDAATGYGQTSTEVGAVRAEATLLIQYHEAVSAQTRAQLDGLTPEDLNRPMDDTWGPNVSLGERLISVIGDDMQHIGQAAYLRGLFGA